MSGRMGSSPQLAGLRGGTPVPLCRGSAMQEHRHDGGGSAIIRAMALFDLVLQRFLSSDVIAALMDVLGLARRLVTDRKSVV